MKKRWLMLAVLCFAVGLAGCKSTKTKSTSKKDDTSLEGISSSADKKEQNSSSEEKKPVSPVSTQKILFVPQKSDVENGYTVENDAALKELEKLVLESQPHELGLEKDVAIHFTGLYMEGKETTDAIFLIVNKTDTSMTNMEFDLSFQTSDGQMILDQSPIRLSEEVFGVLEPNTGMPLYITVPAEKKESLKKAAKERSEQVSLENFEYQEVDSETKDLSKVKNGQPGEDSFQHKGQPSDSDFSNKTSASSLTFRPQRSETEQGLSEENDEILKQLAKTVQQEEVLGQNGKVSVQYTGMTLETVEGTSAVFLIVNRTDYALSNVHLLFSLRNEEDAILLADKSFYLKKEVFGEIQPDTAIPLYAPIPIDQLAAFDSITDWHQTKCTVQINP